MMSWFRGNKIIKPDNQLSKVSHRFLEVIKDQNILTSTIYSMSTMIDESLVNSAMWVKDKQHRYVFGNKKLRDDLFHGVKLLDIIGKTDNQLVFGDAYDISDVETLIKGIVPRYLPHIGEVVNECTRVCNLTDMIATEFGDTSYFIETVGDKLLYTKKTVTETGTTGSYIDVTDSEDSILRKIGQMITDEQCYQIANMASFYIMPGCELLLEVKLHAIPNSNC
jgi:hypothetical protein